MRPAKATCPKILTYLKTYGSNDITTLPNCRKASGMTQWQLYCFRNDKMPDVLKDVKYGKIMANIFGYSRRLLYHCTVKRNDILPYFITYFEGNAI